MRYYAVLDASGICFELRGVHEEVDSDHYIQLETEDFSVLGKMYNNGTWEEVEQPESTPEPLSPTEQAIMQMAINTEYMAAMMEIRQ